NPKLNERRKAWTHRMILCPGIRPPVSMTELQDIIFHAPAGLKLDLILRGHRFVAKLRSLARVPGSRRGRAIDRLVIRSNARYQPVFARRDIGEREGAVVTDNRFGVAQHFIGRVRPGRDQMRAQSIWQSLARLFGDDLTPPPPPSLPP